MLKFLIFVSKRCFQHFNNLYFWDCWNVEDTSGVSFQRNFNIIKNTECWKHQRCVKISIFVIFISTINYENLCWKICNTHNFQHLSMKIYLLMNCWKSPTPWIWGEIPLTDFIYMCFKYHYTQKSHFFATFDEK